ncbi:MAG: hypothetical protein JWM74_992, partial [Myxococcaceae bacterium]|nr:hypothetical protein [Myxococcaceae bacterium]
SVITKIYADVAALNPAPSFVASTGDYVFASANGTQAGPQLDLYLSARAQFRGVLFPALGNHECTGATASNCGAGNADGTPNNYNAFLSKMLGPIQKPDPFYAIDLHATDNTWTAKLVFVAGNAWNASQATWLETTLARPTTYTFVFRHEPSAASTAPGVGPSDQIIGQHPYTLLIVGHTHTYEHYSSRFRQVVIGNGGAPLTGSKNYGFGVFSQRADGAIVVDMIDATTGGTDPAFRFGVKADGSPAP